MRNLFRILCKCVFFVLIVCCLRDFFNRSLGGGAAVAFPLVSSVTVADKTSTTPKEDMNINEELVKQVVEHAIRDYHPHGRAHAGGWGMWRRALPSVLDAVKSLQLPLHAATGDVYQFGIFKGDSMKYLRKVFPDVRLVGCDSFVGLPEDSSGATVSGDWKRGRYSSGDIRDSLTKALGGPKGVALVKGFFNESLTNTLPQQLNLKPAWYIDIDVDLYISTYQALDFMFGQGLVHVGTIIGYDDWWPLSCQSHKRHGKIVSPLDLAEGRAHAEIAIKYGAKFECIAGSCVNDKLGRIFSSSAPIFLVTALGSQDSPNSGFNMTLREMLVHCFKR